jgi:hypothetical protein
MNPLVRVRREDQKLVELLDEFHYLTVKDFEEETGRLYRDLNRRLFQMHARGLVDRHPLYKDTRAGTCKTYVYSLSRAGLALAEGRGFHTEHVHLNPEKSWRMMPHELTITAIHRRVKSAFQLTHWEQRRSVLSDDVFDRQERLTVNADALFALSDDQNSEAEDTSFFFLEVEKSRQAKYRDGESGLVRKVRAFWQYRTQQRFLTRFRDTKMTDFRVLFVLASRERAANFLAVLASLYPYRTFWITDEESLLHDITGAVWRTPKDPETALSLREA